MKARVLLIEDDTSIAAALQKELASEGYEVALAHRGDTGLTQASSENFDAVVTDLKMPGLSGLEVVEQLHRNKPKLPIILITAHGTTETAIEAMKAGAFDYVLKPFEVAELLQLIGKAVKSSRLMSEPVELGEAGSGPAAIVGKSRAMQEIYKQIGRIAATPVSVLIRGETGTGKELIARAVYQHSHRAAKPFIAVNCAAIPDTLLESELFGHERGSFTGAHERRIGRFEQANGGTIFLDEIGDLSPGTQAKLLRVLQEKYVQRLGSKETIPVDVRVVAATHQNLEQAIADKQFREDLFYRLSAVTITLPPLRERADDIPAMAKYFLQRHGTELNIAAPAIQPDAIEYLKGQPWPGNVRELENVLREALLIARGYPITREHLTPLMLKARRSALSADQTIADYLNDLLARAGRGEAKDIHAIMHEDMERELYARAIQLAHGNQAKAARWLGVTRTTMREKLIHFGLHPADDKHGE